jgi:TonB family protein
MRSIFLFLALSMTGISSFAQPKYFEGNLEYHTSVKSLSNILTDKDVGKVFSIGDKWTAAVKEGNYRQRTEYADMYIIRKDKKEYFKFKKLDTLYFLDFSWDTSHVTAILRSDSLFKMNNYDCKAITIKTATVSRRYYYSDSLLLNPEFDKENTIGHYNDYCREAGAIYLWLRSDLSFGYAIANCVRVEKKPIDDHIFDLPALPLKRLDPSTALVSPHFPGKEGAWLKYLQSSLNGDLAGKYVKMPKGQKEASVQVMVQFLVAEDGTISHIEVLNRKEVHPRLAEEAVRVIRESPRWVPARIFGEDISGSIKQPIVFKIQA